MISQCANPSCSVQFHSLKGGRLYRFEVRAPQPPCADVPNSICELKPKRATVYFWMCSQCSSKFSLSFDSQRGVQLTSLKRAPRGDALVIVNEEEPLLNPASACDHGAVEDYH